MPRTVTRSFQARLTVAFVGIVALTLALVAPVVINRLDDYFRQQEEQGLRARRTATANVLNSFIRATVGPAPVVAPAADGTIILNPDVLELLVNRGLLGDVADNVARADVVVTFGLAETAADNELRVVPDPGLAFSAILKSEPEAGQARDRLVVIEPRGYAIAHDQFDWGMEIVLSNPYTSRASTLAAITGLLLVMASIAFGIAVIVAALLAARFTTPLTRLTEASRRLAEGDLGSRVPADEVVASTREIAELSQQFNAMADRLQESVSIIRHDRDRSRDFLADVSHELRTPIAAMRTFNELLQGPAGSDPSARSEFLESSATQLDRLDWLAQNLLELSKLDSGLVLLDLRPEDIRATIESAVEQAIPTAERRGIALHMDLPDRPVRLHHDPPRVGQVVTNLVGNALKFTGRGGRVEVLVRPDADGGARIEVLDTGVGIDAAELPHVFERFYRGSGANEARGTGSGLGLAIVKSIVDMHHGAISVESRVGRGSRFVVTLPRDPREAAEVVAPDPGPAGPVMPGDPGESAPDPKVVDSSPSATSPVNPGQAR
jgi:signal transduction histidine kinase